MITLDWKNATPEQINLWRIASAKIAYNTITPLNFVGAIAGTEYLTYNAGKLYIVLYLCLCSNAPGGQVLTAAELIRDELDNISFYAYNTCVAGANFIYNQVVFKNIYFSHLSGGWTTHLIFNGYRLNV
jgi:hypothetical protein